MSTKTTDMKVKEVMITKDKFAQVAPNEFLKEALDKMTDSKLGIVCIVEDNLLKGVITDGDIRRKLLNVQKPFSAFFIDDVITHSAKSPVTVLSNDTLEFAVEVMGKKQIWDLPVVNNEGKLEGLLHLHPVVKTLLNIQS